MLCKCAKGGVKVESFTNKLAKKIKGFENTNPTTYRSFD
jgi:hypothetical protein